MTIRVLPAAPRVTIIVATYNAAPTLARCIDSILGQTFAAWELLIADGGSVDNTTAVISQHAAALAWWRSEADQGIYDAWNHALAHARGEYVCFLGADDAWASPRALADLFATIGDREFDLVTSRGRMVDADGRGRNVTGNAWDYHRLGRRMVVCHPGLLHRRSLFTQYGLFDIRYRIAGDLEFLLRLPPDIRTLHLESTTVLIEDGGVSRRQVLTRLREQRDILRACKRYGPVRAYLAWADKLWRYPLARLLNIPH